MFGLLRARRAAALRGFPTRQFHAAPVVQERPRQDEYPVDELDLDDSDQVEEMTSVEHLWVGQHRRLLYYMRLIEHELPQLVGELLCFWTLDTSEQLSKSSANPSFHPHLPSPWSFAQSRMEVKSIP